MPKKTSKTRKTTRPAARATARTASRKAPSAKAKSRPAKKPAKAIDQAAMMAAWQKTMAPSDGHRRLEPIVGTFAVKMTFWMSPGQPPMVSDGVSEHRWVLGGRHVEQTFRGTMMGNPFEGIGYTGYDNVQKKYVGCWMDSMCTGLMTAEGEGKPTDQKITFRYSLVEPLVGPSTLRAVVRIQDNDHHTFEMWKKGPDGKEFRNMLCEYTRK